MGHAKISPEPSFSVAEKEQLGARHPRYKVTFMLCKTGEEVGASTPSEGCRGHVCRPSSNGVRKKGGEGVRRRQKSKKMNMEIGEGEEGKEEKEKRGARGR